MGGAAGYEILCSFPRAGGAVWAQKCRLRSCGHTVGFRVHGHIISRSPLPARVPTNLSPRLALSTMEAEKGRPFPYVGGAAGHETKRRCDRFSGYVMIT